MTRWWVVALAIVAYRSQPDERFASITVDPASSKIQLFWKSDDGRPFKTLESLRDELDRHGRRLRFAMNGGMYESGNEPKGLFIQDRQTLHPLDTADGSGNFYLKPNGVFYLTTNDAAFIVQTPQFGGGSDVEFATQSGPMLVIDGVINAVLSPSSSSRKVRNGVGIRRDHTVVFAISREPVSFYELATYFASLGCTDALYLDGVVSRMYLPEQGIVQLDGDFAVIIAIAADR